MVHNNDLVESIRLRVAKFINIDPNDIRLYYEKRVTPKRISFKTLHIFQQLASR